MLHHIIAISLGGALVAGQLLRLPLLGQGGGLLLSDAAVIVTLLAAGWLAVSGDTRSKYQIPNTKYQSNDQQRVLLLFIPFIVWSAFTLVVNSWRYDLGELAIAAAYWARLSSYLLLLPALVFLQTCRPALTQWLTRVMFGSASVLALLGFGQLWLVPDLSVLQAGWDPHLGRLVTTWLDPNFAGLFFVIASGVAAARLVTGRDQLLAGVALASSLVALMLTQSRSALLAGAAALLLCSPVLIGSRRWRQPGRLLAAGASLFALLILLSLLALGERAGGIVTGDATVALRLASLAEVWPLASQHSILGVGYNGYQFAAQQAGLLGDFTIHSRAGADSSLLTLVVTTGLVGALLFSTPWLVILRWLLQRGRVGSPLAWAGGLSILAVAGHSLLVNSWLYAHILLTLAVVVSVGLADPKTRS